MRRQTHIVIVSLACVLLGGAAAMAEVADMRALVSDDPTLVNHWTFEGASTAERQQDKKGTAHLTAIASSHPSASTAAISYPQGFDASTETFQPQFIWPGDGIGAGGGAWQDGAALWIPDPNYLAPVPVFVLEGLVRNGPQTYADGHLFIRPQKVWNPGSPIYPFRQSGLGGGAWDNLFAGGTGDWCVPPPFLNCNSLPVVVDYNVGDWYYFVVAYEDTRVGANPIKIYSYSANLSASDAVVTLVVNGYDVPGTLENVGTMLGIGAAGDYAHFDGQIDELAVYNALLSMDTMNEHLAAIYQQPPRGTVIMIQ